MAPLSTTLSAPAPVVHVPLVQDPSPLQVRVDPTRDLDAAGHNDGTVLISETKVHMFTQYSIPTRTVFLGTLV